MTFTELCERLTHLEETLLLEVLDINSTEIVGRFEDKIEDKRDYLEDDLELDDEWNDDELLDSTD